MYTRINAWALIKKSQKRSRRWLQHAKKKSNRRGSCQDGYGPRATRFGISSLIRHWPNISCKSPSQPSLLRLCLPTASRYSDSPRRNPLHFCFLPRSSFKLWQSRIVVAGAWEGRLHAAHGRPAQQSQRQTTRRHPHVPRRPPPARDGREDVLRTSATRPWGRSPRSPTAVWRTTLARAATTRTTGTGEWRPAVLPPERVRDEPDGCLR
jgi:hypothetical protein